MGQASPSRTGLIGWRWMGTWAWRVCTSAWNEREAG